MGALMHTLLADELAQRGETIPGLLVTDLSAGESEQKQRLMADNAEQREQIESLSRRVAALSAENADLKAKIARITAASSLIAPKGYVIADLPIPGGAKAVIEAYYEAPEPATSDEPGDPGECYAERVLISTRDGDRLVSITDLIEALNDERAVTKAVEAMR